MLDAVGHLLPIACALALSSVPIMATIVLLLSPNRRRSGLPFLIGWIIGIALVLTAFTLLAGLLPPESAKNPDVWVGVLLIIVGSATVIYSVWRWRHPHDVINTEGPKWLAMVEKIGPLAAFGLAFLLNLRPKSILLNIAAGISLASGNLSPSGLALAIGIYTLIAASTVITPIIYTLVNPVKAEAVLVRARGWIILNSGYVTLSIMILIGVVIIGSGFEHL